MLSSSLADYLLRLRSKNEKDGVKPSEAGTMIIKSAIREEEPLPNASINHFSNPGVKRTFGFFKRRGSFVIGNPDNQSTLIPTTPKIERVSAWGEVVAKPTPGSQFSSYSIFARREKTERPPVTRAPPGFVPRTRSLNTIREDDEKAKEDYYGVYKTDEPVVVEGITSIVDVKTWEEMGLPPVLMENIERSNYIKPRNVQRVVIPLILDCYDVVAVTETGSGKTAAFLIPIIAKIMEETVSGSYNTLSYLPYAIIVGPTRELLHQGFEQAKKLCEGTGVTVAVCYGEYGFRQNTYELSKGCDILFVTPGRLKHCVEENFIQLKRLRIFVFDEGDHMLKRDFMDDIAPALNSPFFPKNMCQMLFFSATFDDLLLANATEYIRDTASVFISTKKRSPNKLCSLEFARVLKDQRFEKLYEFLESGFAKEQNEFKQILIFVQTQALADEVGNELVNHGYPATFIRGNYGQDRRLKAFDDFRHKRIPILVSTDVCARGIDIKDIDCVLNFSLPYDYDTFIYRAGRVGRIKKGLCYSFVDPKYDHGIIQEIVAGLTHADIDASSSLDMLHKEIQAGLEQGLYKDQDEAFGFDVYFGS